MSQLVRGPSLMGLGKEATLAMMACMRGHQPILTIGEMIAEGLAVMLEASLNPPLRQQDQVLDHAHRRGRHRRHQRCGPCNLLQHQRSKLRPCSHSAGAKWREVQMVHVKIAWIGPCLVNPLSANDRWLITN